MPVLSRSQHQPSPPRFRRVAALAALATVGSVLAGCASGGGAAGAPPTAARPMIAAADSSRLWPVQTRENVDLWLHGFALLQQDTALVPFFRRGYRDEMTVLKNRASVITQLDVNATKLRARFAADPSLVNAQFVPFSFASVDEMRATIDRFVQANGNPQSGRTPREQGGMAVLASYFPDAPARAWLALFASGLWDEDAKFYHSYWVQQQRERAGVIDSVSAMWEHTVRPRLQRILTSTRQRDGVIILSLPLDGEGRTVSGGGAAANAIGVTFPDRVADAPGAIYVVAHEVMGSVAGSVIADNTTPAEQRSGAADRLQSPAAVRGGLLLLEQMLPQLADGYARYYVRAAGRTPGRDVRAQLAALFPIPATIATGLARQLTLLQGGI